MTDAAARAAVAAWLPAITALSPLGQGHINDTWLVEAAGQRYVLQRLSAAVFPDPRAVMDNVARVVAHLESAGGIRVPGLCITRSGAAWYGDADGGAWRLWDYLERTRTLERLTSPAQAEAAGRAFGAFQLAVAGVSGPLNEAIPGFLRLPGYFDALDVAVVEAAPTGEARDLLARMALRRELADWFSEPDRVIHGDCKVDNLLFHATRDEVAAVVDLDTVMTGHWAWDFGDLVRSAAADDGRFSVERFTAICRGYLASGALAADRGVSSLELALAPRHVALMLAVRFLTDHLRGDRYFKVHAPGENLLRAAQQFSLLEDMERQEAAMLAAARALTARS